eukprot:1137424-Pelagomonas_calceolata.AAC.4
MSASLPCALLSFRQRSSESTCAQYQPAFAQYQPRLLSVNLLRSASALIAQCQPAVADDIWSG